MLPALLVLLLAPVAILADTTTCPKGYVNSTVDGAMFCYKIYKTLLPRDQAEAQCNQDGATLVKISSPGQNNLITTVAKGLSTVHIGVQCYTAGFCKFDDGRILSTNQTSFFYGGLATPEVGQCVILDTTNDIFNGKWISVACSTVSAFVCQVDPTVASYYQSIQKSNCNSFFWLTAPINITSPNYPSNYDNYQNCVYFLHGGPFLIQFDYFYTEQSKDYLYIYEGYEYSGMTYKGSYSGNYGSFSYQTTYATAMLVFVSDAQTTYQGFHAQITQHAYSG